MRSRTGQALSCAELLLLHADSYHGAQSLGPLTHTEHAHCVKAEKTPAALSALGAGREGEKQQAADKAAERKLAAAALISTGVGEDSSRVWCQFTLENTTAALW